MAVHASQLGVLLIWVKGRLCEETKNFFIIFRLAEIKRNAYKSQSFLRASKGVKQLYLTRIGKMPMLS